MGRLTGWGTASGRRDVRQALGDNFESAEHLRMLAMKPTPNTSRKGARLDADETGPAVWGTLVEEAVRKDACNGFYVTDATLNNEGGSQ